MDNHKESYEQLLQKHHDLKAQLNKAKKEIQALKVDSLENSALNIINSINEAVNKGESIDSVISLLQNLIIKYFKPTGITLYEISDDKKFIVYKSKNSKIKPLKQKIEKIIGKKIPQIIKIPLNKNNLYSKIIKEKKPVLIDNRKQIIALAACFTSNKLLIKLIPKIIEAINIKSVINFPLLVKNEVIGLFDISSREIFTTQLLDILTKIANQLSIILSRRQFEEEVFRNEERLKLGIECGNLGIWDHDFKTGEIYRSRRWAEMLGYTEKEIGSSFKTWKNLIHKDDWNKTEKAIKDHESDKTGYFCVDHRLRAKNGTYKWIKNSGKIIKRDRNGKPLRALGFHQDINETKKNELKLAHSESLNRDILNSISDAVYVTNKSGKFTFICQNVDVIFGYSKNEIEQMGNIQYLLGKNLYNQNELKRKGEIENIEKSIVDKNGNIHHLLINVKKVKLEEGNVLITCRDVTERRKFQQSLKLSEEKFRRLFEAANVSIALSDENGKLISVNKKFSDFLGYKMSELIGISALSITHPEDAENESKILSLPVAKRIGKHRIIKRYITKNKKTKWADVSIFPILKNHTKNEFLFAVVVIDITDQKLNEQKIKENEQKLRLVTENINDVFWMSTPGIKDIIYISPAYEKIWGRKSVDLYKNPKEFIDSIVAEDKENYLKIVKNYHKQGKKYEYEYRINDAKGKLKWIKERGFPVKNESGKTVQITGICTDITQSKLKDIELKRKSLLLQDISKTQNKYIAKSGSKRIFDSLLKTMIKTTESEFGFLDEVVYDEAGTAHKLSLALTNISWNNDSRKLYNELKSRNFEFRNLKNLAGLPLIKKEVVISNNVAKDKRAAGLPHGHPSIKNYMGMPVYFGGTLVGVAGVANNKAGYSEEMAHFLKPFLTTCGSIIHAKKNEEIKEKQEKQLQENESRFKAMMNAPTDAMWILLDRKGIILIANEATLKRFNKRLKDVIGTNVFDYSPNTLRINIKKHFNKILKTGRPVQFEEERLGKIINSNMYPVFNNDKKVKQVAIFSQDITEKKQAEEKLKASEEKFRSYIENAPDGVFIADENGKYIEVNQAACEITGYSAAELLKMGIHDLLQKNEQEKGINHFKDVKEKGAAQIKIGFVTKSGENRFWIVSAVKLSENKFLGFVKDVTRQSIAEEKLRKSLTDLQLAQKIAAIGNWQFDPEVGIPVWSEKIYEIYDLDPKHGPPHINEYKKIYKPDQYEIFHNAIQNAIEKGKPYDIKLRFRSKKNKTKYIRAICHPDSKKTSKGYFLHGTIQDITTQVKSEEDLAKRENLLKLAAKTAQLGYYEINIETGEAVWSNETYRIFGINPLRWSPTVGNYGKVIHPDDRKVLFDKYDYCIKNKKPFEMDYRIIHTNGQVRYVRSIARFTSYNGDKPIMFGTLQDITKYKQLELQLAESEKKFRTLFEATDVAMGIVDKKGYFLLINNAAIKYLEYQKKEIIKLNFKDITYPEDLNKSLQLFKKYLNNGQSYTIEKRYITKNKKIKWGLTTISPVFDAKNNFMYAIAHLQDITIRKIAESNLKESEQRYRNLYHSTPVMLHSIDIHGKIIRVSDFWLKKLGYQRNEVLGKKSIDFLTKTSKKYAQEVALPKFFKKGRIRNVPYQMVKKDGRVLDVLLSANAEYDNNKKFIQTLAVTVDISDKKAAEMALKKSEEIYRGLVENAGQPIFQVNKKGQFLFMNTVAAKMVGIKPGKFEGKTMWDLFPKDIADRQMTDVKKVVKTGKTLALENYTILKGKPYWFDTRLWPINNNDGKVIAVQAFTFDITERKQQEMELIKSKKMIEDIINLVPVRIFWKDKKLIYLGCNNIFARDAGFKSPEDIIGKDDFQMGWKDQAELYRKDDQKVLSSGKAKYLIEEPQTTPEGKTIHLLTSKVPLKNIKGEIYGVLGTYLDVTELKQAEQALKKSESINLSLLQTATAGIGFYDPQGRVIFFNELALKYLGGKVEQYIGKSIVELFGKKHGTIYLNRLKAAKKAKQPLKFEDYIIINNQKNWLISNYSRVTDQNDKLIGIMIISHDITEQKNIQTELEKLTLALEEAQELSSIGSWDWNLKTNSAWWSDGLYKIYGLDKGKGLPDIKKNNWLKFVHPEDRKNVENIVTNAITKKSSYEVESRIIRQNDKAVRTLATRGKIICDKDGKAERLIGTTQDITELKQNENDLINMQERLRKLALKQQSAREEERQIVAREIHDELGQALTGVKIDMVNYISIHLKNNPDISKKINEYIRYVDSMIKSVKRITSHLRPVILEDMGLSAAIEYLIEDVQNKSQIKFKLEMEPEEISTTPILSINIFRIIQEAITNIIKHSKAKNTVILMKQSEKKITISIKDDGIGIHMRDINKHRSFGILGMRERVASLGGEFEFESNVNEGTTIHVTLPNKIKDA